MPDAIRHTISVDERHRLRRQAVAVAGHLVNSDAVQEGATILNDYRRRFGQSDNNFLRFGLASLFMSNLMRRCCPHQCRQVSYLLDEHMSGSGSVAMEQILRQSELAMYRRVGDRDGEAKCIRILKGLNKRK
jgi:hypothetical protein